MTNCLEAKKDWNPLKETAAPGEPLTIPDELLKAHRMCLHMMRFPHLLEEMRRIFLSALETRGICNADTLRSRASQWLQDHGEDLTEENISMCVQALTDLYFVRHHSQEEIRDHIDLARKKDAFQKLRQVLLQENVTSIRIKDALKEFCEIPQGSLRISPEEAEGVRVALIQHFISGQLPFIGIAKNHITIRDVADVLDHSLWDRRRSGKIGGKAAGMLLARSIVLPRLGPRDPDMERYVATPESFFLNSGILSDFIDHNRLDSFHTQKYKSVETLEAEYGTMSQLLEKASFPPDVVEDFRTLLERVGQAPLILRSSSLLEDNLGYVFSGKYDSIFLANQGDLQVRLNDFMWGLKQILKSTFSPSAILYRRDHDLLDFDERMSVLVQKVAGRRFGPYFFPFAAGVAFSRNPYAWSPRIRKEDGFVRLVLGLGTRAVERSGPGYPLMVPLGNPTLTTEVTAPQVRKYSQKLVDVLNLESRRFESVPFMDLFREIRHPDLFQAVSVDVEGHLAPPLYPAQPIDVEHSCITFANFISRSPFVPLMRKILKQLETAYGRPVDVEFAWDAEKLFLLQCRPLATREDMPRVTLPANIPDRDVLFRNRRDVTNAMVLNIEYLVYVDPKAYMRISSLEERMELVRVIGRINRFMEDKRYALFGPPRWGSNDVTQGVRVGYEDIRHTLILGEVAFEREGITPDVSYGTHFFSDLIEARIIPLAIYPDESETVWNEDFLLQSENLLPEILPDYTRFSEHVRVIHIPSNTKGRFLQVYQDGETQEGVGFFGKEEKSFPSN